MSFETRQLHSEITILSSESRGTRKRVDASLNKESHICGKSGITERSHTYSSFLECAVGCCLMARASRNP